MPRDPDARIKRLLPRHYKMLDMALAGHGPAVIAETIGMSASAVGMVMGSPLFQAELSRMRQEAKEEVILSLDRQAVMSKARSILEQASVAAAETQVDLLEAANESVRLRAAESILDRALGQSRDSNGPMVVNVNVEQLNLLQQALKESRDVHAELPAANSPSAQAPQHEHQHVQEGAETGTQDDGPGPSEAQDHGEVR